MQWYRTAFKEARDADYPLEAQFPTLLNEKDRDNDCECSVVNDGENPDSNFKCCELYWYKQAEADQSQFNLTINPPEDNCRVCSTLSLLTGVHNQRLEGAAVCRTSCHSRRKTQHGNMQRAKGVIGW